MSTKTKSLNPTQIAFLEEVEKHPEGITLFELKLAGKEFKSGSVNTLVKQGYCSLDSEDRVFECDIVFNGQVIGTTKKTGKVFKFIHR